MDKDLKKLKILMNAINEVEEENQEEEFDEASDFYAELKEAAWNILHENPGTDFGGLADDAHRAVPDGSSGRIGHQPS